MSLPTGDELFAALARGATEAAEEEPLTIVRDLAGARDGFSREQVFELARGGAAALREAGLAAGDRVLLELPNDETLVAAMLGAFHLGATPACVAPLGARGAAAREEWQDLVRRARPALVVTATERDDAGAPVLGAAALLDGNADAAGEPASGASLRYLQFSSGSTGRPKALVIDMPGIVFNMAGMTRHIPLRRDDHIVSWLPAYHDMGLFGALLITLFHGNRLTWMDPALFARSPTLWFKVIAEVGGTITVGPPSAYRAAMALLERRPLEGLDLSRCTRWLCGAEQVTPDVARGYLRVLSAFGAPENGLKPVYGMSEITLAATIPAHGQGATIDWIDRVALQERGVADPVNEEHPDAQGWVAVGSPMDGQGLRVVDDEGRDLPDRSEGRILLRSPSLYRWELVDGELTDRVGEWHDTGDLGYLVDGILFITGRTRDLIIKGGRNYSPERVEELAALLADVSRAAAFGVRDDARATERVVVMAEAHPRAMRDAGSRDGLRLSVRRALGEAGYDVDEVVLVARGSLPRTTSGKIRRVECRERYLAGSAEAPR